MLGPQLAAVFPVGCLVSNIIRIAERPYIAAGTLQATQWKSGPYSVCTALNTPVTLPTVGT